MTTFWSMNLVDKCWVLLFNYVWYRHLATACGVFVMCFALNKLFLVHLFFLHEVAVVKHW